MNIPNNPKVFDTTTHQITENTSNTNQVYNFRDIISNDQGITVIASPGSLQHLDTKKKNKSGIYKCFISVKYIIEYFANENINIPDLCKDSVTNAHNVLKIGEKIKPLLTDRSLKTKITKLSNLLYQSMVHTDNGPIHPTSI